MAKRNRPNHKTAAKFADAVAFADAETERCRESPPVDVKAIRKARGMTQEAFASAYGFTLGAVRDWEQGRKSPERTARVLLRVVADAPEAVARAVAKS